MAVRTDLQIQPLGYALGAEISGLDLREEQSDATIAAIRQAMLDYIVLCFRGQDLEPEQLVAFSSRFGALDDNRANPHLHHPDIPTVFMVNNNPVTVGEKRFQGGVADKWHTDLSHTDRPATASFLLAKELPDVGGNTMFANMYMAYETLSPTLRGILDPLGAIHDVSLSPMFKFDPPEVQAARRKKAPPIVHPVVRVHPESGRKMLYVSDRVRQFVGMTEEETKPFLEFLVKHATRYEFLYRHVWSNNDLVVWDNRCAMHFAVQDYDRSKMRNLIRCSLLPPKSGDLYEGPVG